MVALLVTHRTNCFDSVSRVPALREPPCWRLRDQSVQAAAPKESVKAVVAKDSYTVKIREMELLHCADIETTRTPACMQLVPV